jgi:hypothetical protein
VYLWLDSICCQIQNLLGLWSLSISLSVCLSVCVSLSSRSTYIYRNFHLFSSCLSLVKHRAAVRTCRLVIRLPLQTWLHLVADTKRPRLTIQGCCSLVASRSVASAVWWTTLGTPQSEKKIGWSKNIIISLEKD